MGQVVALIPVIIQVIQAVVELLGPLLGEEDKQQLATIQNDFNTITSGDLNEETIQAFGKKLGEIGKLAEGTELSSTIGHFQGVFNANRDEIIQNLTSIPQWVDTNPLLQKAQNLVGNNDKVLAKLESFIPVKQQQLTKMLDKLSDLGWSITSDKTREHESD